MLKHSLIAASVAAALLAPAFAQAPIAQDAVTRQNELTPGHDTTPRPGFLQNQSMTDWRSTKLVGANVYGPGDSKIGDISDVLISGEGGVRAVVVGVGGFLGVGEKNVAVPFKALTITRKADGDQIEKISVDYTKDELTKAPAFAYYQPAKPATTGASVADKAKDMKAKEKTK